MPMPTHLKVLIDQTLGEIRYHPEHRIEPKRRREIYNAFGPKEDIKANRSRGWLAVISARYVLPIFERGFPDVDTPSRLIDIAEKTARGAFDAGTAVREASNGQEMAGRLWGYDETVVPWNASMAGNTAHRALAEAAGLDPFESKITGVVGTKASNARRVLIDELPDEKLAKMFGDTASAAVVAFAWSPGNSKCDPSKMLEFWEWWLTKAIPKALEMALQT